MPYIKKIVDLPDAGILKGITRTFSYPTNMLITDATQGKIIFFDTLTGCYDMVQENVLLPIPASNASYSMGKLGVSSIRTKVDNLLLINEAISSLGQVVVSDNGTAEIELAALPLSTEATPVYNVAVMPLILE